MSRIGRVVLLLACCWAAAWPLEAAAQVPLEGVYAVQGSSPGSAGVYTGEATVTRRGAIYKIVWQIGAARHVGTGILADNRFAAVYQPPGERPGIVIFETRSDGSLAGLWTALGADSVGLEVWTPKTRP
ncbi:MAG: hypothetical protein FJX55_17075 [Alphaproteobacteria bacterium]|nr:hypothetical protein [Alphaproteobacteria bacterium]